LNFGKDIDEVDIEDRVVLGLDDRDDRRGRFADIFCSLHSSEMPQGSPSGTDIIVLIAKFVAGAELAVVRHAGTF
jgi:N-acetylmuramoyl-L-alanine amidase